jgi:hypothetical protein
LEQARGRLDNIHFYFIEKLLPVDEVVLLFHLNDRQVLKEIRLYLENYGF